jgi:hypothetical protein
MTLLVVAGQLLPGKVVRVGKEYQSRANPGAGLEALIALTEKAA